MKAEQPMAVSDCLANDGTPHVIRWRDRDYPVGVPCPAVIERVEKFVIRAALDAVEETKGVLTPAEYDRDVKALQSDIRTRQYRPGGSMWSAEMRAESGTRGLLLMLWSCMAEVHDDKTPTPTPDDVTAMYHEATAEVLVAAALVLPDFTRRAGERRKLPPLAIAAEVKQATERAERVKAAKPSV